jgi:hypothetical protein
MGAIRAPEIVRGDQELDAARTANRELIANLNKKT